jgi:hypothetical protein
VLGQVAVDVTPVAKAASRTSAHSADTVVEERILLPRALARAGVSETRGDRRSGHGAALPAHVRGWV